MLSSLAPIKGPNSKPAYQQLWEKLNWGARQFISPDDYKTYRLYERGRNTQVALRYLSGPRTTRIQQALNQDHIIFKDKLKFDAHFGAFDLPIPKILGVVGPAELETNHLRLTDAQELVVFLREMVSSGNEIVIKQSAGSEGTGVKVLTGWSSSSVNDRVVQSNGQEISVGEIARELKDSGGTWLIQERVRQHPLIEALNPSSLNTMRVGAFRCKDGTVKLPFAVLRMGTAASQIDAYASGGLAVRVNPQSGEVADKAFRKAKFATELVERHPDSGIEFRGMTIPFWDEVKSILASFSRHAGDNRFIGWDVAFTPEGPIIIEGNHAWDAHIAQQESEGMLTDEFVHMLREEAGIILDNQKLPRLDPLNALRAFLS